MSLLVLVVVLSPLAVIIPTLGTVIRRWRIQRKRPYTTATHEWRYAASTIVIILAMDVGLVLVNVASVVVLGGSIVGNGISTLVILLVARWELRMYRIMMAKAHQAENEEIAKLGIPEYPPDDL